MTVQTSKEEVLKKIRKVGKVITHSVALISLRKIISALINTVSIHLSFPLSAS